MLKYFQKGLLNKKAKAKKREKTFNNFDTAQNIGILFDAHNVEDFRLIKKYTKELKQKNIKCITLGFFNEKEVPDEYLFISNFSYFNSKDFCILGNPKKREISIFMQEKFDLLLVLSVNEYDQFDIITKLSNAKCIVGKQFEESKYDFNLGIKEESITNLIDQINHYLSIIKK